MKTAAICGALVAALAAGALTIPTASAAQPYGYASDCRNDGTAGTIIGGIAGALLGSSVAPHHGNRAGGAAIGGVAGALIGNSIARSSGCQTNDRAYSSGYGYENRSYGYAPSYGYAYSSPSYAYSYPSYSYSTYDRDRRDHDRGHDWRRDHDHDRDYGGWHR